MLHLNSNFPLIQSVINGSQDGVIIAIDDSILVVHKSGFGKLIHNKIIEEDVYNLLKNTDTPQYHHLYDCSKELIHIISKRNDFFRIWIRNRIQLIRITKEIVHINPIRGFYVERVTNDNFNKLSSFSLNLHNKFYRSQIDFIENAMGWVVFNDLNEPCAICYAAAIGNSKAEVDVFTSEKFRAKGLGTLVTSYFINNCVENGIIPNWDCFKENLASIKTSISLGFVLNMQYFFLSIEKKHESKSINIS